MAEPGGGRPVTVSDVQQLVRRKDEIEAQIKACYELLEGVSARAGLGWAGQGRGAPCGPVGPAPSQPPPLPPQQKGVGMHEPLVDAEGFPRADIDLYQVRTARHNIICERGTGTGRGGLSRGRAEPHPAG